MKKVQFQRLSELGVSFEACGSATTNINTSISTDSSNDICYTKDTTSSTNKRCEKGDTTDQLLNIGNRGWYNCLWDTRYKQFCEFKTKHGHVNVSLQNYKSGMI